VYGLSRRGKKKGFGDEAGDSSTGYGGGRFGGVGTQGLKSGLGIRNQCASLINAPSERGGKKRFTIGRGKRDLVRATSALNIFEARGLG